MKKTILRTLTLTIALSIAAINIAFAGGSIGHGNISVYKDDVLVTKMSGQNPIEDGTMLICDGKCMLKSEGISLIALDKSQLGVANESDTFRLYMREGSADYIINNNARKVAFHTPEGAYTLADVVFDTDTPVVKGNIQVDEEGNTEIIVSEGRMVFATEEGMKTVNANHKIVLAIGQTPCQGCMIGAGVVAAWAGGAALANSNRNDEPPTIRNVEPLTISTSETGL